LQTKELPLIASHPAGKEGGGKVRLGVTIMTNGVHTNGVWSLGEIQ